MAAETTSAAAGAQMVGGTAGALGVGAILAAVVVMCATPPRSAREWAIGLISTVVLSIAGGAWVIKRFGLLAMVTDWTGLAVVLGVAFACGLPAWAIVRAVFTWLAKREGKDAGELLRDAAADARSVVNPPPAP